MEAKYGPLENNRVKKLTSIEITFFRRLTVYNLFWQQRKGEILEEMKVEPVGWRETKKIQIKLATTCNKNEQQQDANNYAEL